MATDRIKCACDFCEEFQSAHSGRIITCDERFMVLPTMGCFTPGYCLVMPREHERSFARLAEADLMDAGFVETVRATVTDVFGPAIIAEHGPGHPNEASAACCDHAHLHVIPAEPYHVVRKYEEHAGSPTLLGDLGDLADWGERSYILLSPLPRIWMVWPDSGLFPSQFVRRVCASLRGIDEFYDWAVFPYRENMIETREKLRPRLSLETRVQ